MICIVLHLVVLRGAAAVLHLMLRERVRSCRGGGGSQGSFAAGAVAVVELRHGRASTRTQLAVGRRTRLDLLEAVA